MARRPVKDHKDHRDPLHAHGFSERLRLLVKFRYSVLLLTDASFWGIEQMGNDHSIKSWLHQLLSTCLQGRKIPRLASITIWIRLCMTCAGLSEGWALGCRLALKAAGRFQCPYSRSLEFLHCVLAGFPLVFDGPMVRDSCTQAKQNESIICLLAWPASGA